MPVRNADLRAAQGRIVLAIAIGLCLMLGAIVLVRPDMAMRLMHDAMSMF